MGFFSDLGTESYDRTYTDRQLVQRLWVYFSPYRVRLAGVAFLLITLAMASAGMPLLVSYGVDLIAVFPTDREIYWLTGAVLGVGLYNWGANWIRRRLTARLIGDVIFTIRTDAFHAATSHDLSFHDQFSSGKIVSRITSDTRDFGQLVTLVTDIIAQTIQAIVLAVVLLTISWRLSLVMFGFLPILFYVSKAFRGLARKVTRRGMRAMANVNATIKETVSGIAAKNFRQETAIFNEFDQANQNSFKVNVQRGFLLSLVFPSLNVLGGIATAILVYVGGLSAASGAISVGAWYLFLMSLDRFFFPVLNLSAFWAQVQSGLSAAERSFGLIDAESSVVQIEQQDVTRLRGDIRFVDLCFQYTDQEQVLENFNFHIRSGESVALVGHTGAGKSSIAKLIARS
jgi:ATP-binding cassette subfamily B protein